MQSRLRCVAAAITAAIASRLPPSAVQRGEGRYIAAAATGRGRRTVHRGSKFLFIHDTFRIDSLYAVIRRW
uniref:Uncharacterized protein n=1 Tax=Hordeum vulgare subsp. vulgare TaxID=112509 RepID=A0A8I6YFE6_HORVV